MLKNTCFPPSISNKTSKFKPKLLFTCISLVLALPSNLAFAQEATDKDEVEVEEVIQITGTRIKNQLPTEKLLVVDSQEIENRGVFDMQSLLYTITANTSNVNSSTGAGQPGLLTADRGDAINNSNGGAGFNLRGTGARATLVLVNGRRLTGNVNERGGFADIAGIPIDAVERVEILQGGASAIYGSDAVGGVVNIILKDSYEGLTVSASLNSGSNGGDDKSLVIQGGMGWDSGNMIVSARIDKSDPILQSAFGYENNDFSSIGRTNFERGTSPFGMLSFFSFVNDSAFAMRPENWETAPGIDELIFDSSQFEHGMGQGTKYRDPETDSTSLFASVTQEIGDLTEVKFDATYNDRDTFFVGSIPQIIKFAFPETDVNPSTSFANYRYLLQREYEAGLVSRATTEDNTKDWNLGATINTEYADWDINLNVSYGEQKSQSLTRTFNSFVDIPVDVPNYLGDDQLAENLKLGIQLEPQNDKATNLFMEASATGELFELPAGALSVAFGAGFRLESFDQDALNPDDQKFVFGDAEREVTSAFVEFFIPVFDKGNRLPGLYELGFTLAGRYENYKDDINTFETNFSSDDRTPQPVNLTPERDNFSPKVGLSWRPIEDIRFTASYGESFVTPLLNIMGRPFFSTIGRGIIDPDDPFTPGETVFGYTFTRNSSNIEDELSENFNLGINYTPGAIKGLSINLDYYDIAYENALEFTPSSDVILAFPELYGQFIERDEQGVLTGLVFPLQLNSAEKNLSGVELGVKYTGKLAGGNFTAQFETLRPLETSRRITPDTELFELDGTILAPLDNASTIRFNWNNDNWNYNFAVNYKSGYDINNKINPEFGLEGSTLVDSVTTLDFNVSYSFTNADNSLLSDIRIRMGATNLLDEEAPFANQDSGVSTYNYDPRGRVAFLEITKNF